MIITAKDFRASQSRYIGAAYQGEAVLVKARAGDFLITPIKKKNTKKKGLKNEIELVGYFIAINGFFRVCLCGITGSGQSF